MGVSINVHPPCLQGCWNKGEDGLGLKVEQLHHTKWYRQLEKSSIRASHSRLFLPIASFRG